MRVLDGKGSLNKGESDYLLRAGISFFISFCFYIILAGSLDVFNLVTGFVTALIVAATLSNTMFSVNSLGSSIKTGGRLMVYIPLLLFEIVKANLRTTYLILHPKMPIDTEMIVYDPGFENDLASTVFANSVTLTPGTLTAKINGEGFLVHTLDSASREGMEDGSLEKGVRYVFRDSERAGERGGLKRA